MTRYYTRLRPVGIGTIPKVRWEFVEVPLNMAHMRPDLPVTSRPYGVFTTDRPLTDRELYDFEISRENTMTTYTVIDRAGTVIDRHLTAAEAAHVILTDDGREYDIRQDKDGGWTLWSRQQVANRGWSADAVWSIHTDKAEAEADIFRKVVDADWPRYPEAITDEAYDRMLAEQED